MAGVTWGSVAVVVALAMRQGSLPAPADVTLPVAIALVALYAPFIVGIGLESVFGRSAIGLFEVIIVSIVAGILLALLLAFLWSSAQRVPAAFAALRTRH